MFDNHTSAPAPLLPSNGGGGRNAEGKADASLNVTGAEVGARRDGRDDWTKKFVPEASSVDNGLSSIPLGLHKMGRDDLEVGRIKTEELYRPRGGAGAGAGAGGGVGVGVGV